MPQSQLGKAEIALGRVAFLTHAKAGSQWITDVLTDRRILACVPDIHGIFANGREFELTDFTNGSDGTVVGPIFGASRDLWDRARQPGDKAVRVGRDPRDTVVSLCFSLTYSHVSERETPLIREALLCLDPMHRLMLTMYNMLHTKVSHVQSWGRPAITATEFITTYERVLENQEGEFARIFDFLGWEISPGILQAVVDDHSFRQRSGGRERGVVDAFSHYRSGVPGDWRNHFNRRLCQLFEETYPRLLIDLGYEESEDWWRAVPENVGLPDEDAAFDIAGDSAGLQRQVQALSTAMTSALAERDARWSAQMASVNERSSIVEQAAADLLVVCEERLEVINKQAELNEALHATLAEREQEFVRANSELAAAAADRLRQLNESAIARELASARADALEGACEERLAELRHASAAREAAELRANELARICEERLAELNVAATARALAESRATELEGVCDERLVALNAAAAARALVESRAAELERSCEERLVELNAAAAARELAEGRATELERSCGERLVELNIAAAARELAESRAVELERICDERLALIDKHLRMMRELTIEHQLQTERLTAECEQRLEIITEQARAIEAHEQVVADLQHTLNERSASIDHITAEAEVRLSALNASRENAVELERACAERLELIESQAQALTELRVSNEQLKRACDERLAVIEEQAAALSGTGRPTAPG